MDIFIVHRSGACAKEADDKRIVNCVGMNAELPFAPAIRCGDLRVVDILFRKRQG
jgi:hypothetical protein